MNTRSKSSPQPGSRRYRLCNCALLLALSIGGPANATDHDAGVWSVFTTTDTFSTGEDPSRWSYWLDAQLRYFDVGSGANQALIRPAIGYRLKDNLQVWLGYGRFRTRNVAGAVSNENRWFQQANWSVGALFGGTITLRARLLQRDLSTGDDLGWVVRLSTKYTRALTDEGHRTLILNFEPFIDLRDTDWGGDARVSQTRAYAGIGWRLSDTLSLETGYMNLHFWQNNREDTSNHLLVLNLKAKF